MVRVGLVCVILALGPCRGSWAAQPPAPDPAQSAPQTATEAQQQGDKGHGEHPAEEGKKKNSGRIFWLIPNFTTVENITDLTPPTTKETFVMASQDSFDPFAFPYVAFITVLNYATNQTPAWNDGAAGWGKRYGAAFADNAIGNFMTQAIVPWAVTQDPRYLQLGHGSGLHRAGYAVSRVVVTRSDGWRRFNISEIGGNALGAGIASAYYPPSDRTASAFFTRWASQVLQDAVSFELKEFWPDIHRKMLKRRHGTSGGKAPPE
ncbi:MAG TPA: hypothetical protein VGY48_09345 [Vicinamibacterales bacterium]|jgi:hypothetical protein|nr:hypothetical protein [Vicinamibacterales bacterium]